MNVIHNVVVDPATGVEKPSPVYGRVPVANRATFESLGAAGFIKAGTEGVTEQGEILLWTGTQAKPVVQAVSGLAGNFILQGVGTYDGTVMGYRVVAQGSGNWTLDPVGGSPISVVQTAFTVGQVYPEQLDSITVPTGGSAILYIP